MKPYRARPSTFTFPFRLGGRSQATGFLNQPSRPGGKTPPIKQFTQMKPGRPKPRQK